MTQNMWVIGLITYLALGVFITRYTRARDEISDSLNASPAMFNFTIPQWRKMVFLLIGHIASVLLWPIFLRGWFSKK